MRQELRDKIIAFNRRYARINKELSKCNMHLCEYLIFKGTQPCTEFMGHMNDYEEIIEREKKLRTNAQLSLFE